MGLLFGALVYFVWLWWLRLVGWDLGTLFAAVGWFCWFVVWFVVGLRGLDYLVWCGVVIVVACFGDVGLRVGVLVFFGGCGGVVCLIVLIYLIL